MKTVKILCINSLIILFLLELVSFIFIRFFHFAPYPSAYILEHEATVFDSSEVFGVWHPKSTTTKSIGGCWSVTYNFNSAGARDVERDFISDKSRFLLIGDSFFEGFGVESEERFQNALEEKTGQEFMSFASSGNFGPTQMQLLYDTLASKYDHEYLIVSFFPLNDFDDDDLIFGMNTDGYKDRYRPYYVKDSLNEFHLEYQLPNLKESAWYYKNVKPKSLKSNFKEIWNAEVSIKEKFHTFHKGFFFSRSLLRTVLRRYSLMSSEGYRNQKSDVFQNPNPEHLERFFYVMKKIKETAGNRKIIILTIAHPLDYIAFENGGSNILGKAVSTFCQENDMKHIDLLEELGEVTKSESISLPCDGHWSRKGHSYVTDVVYQKLNEWDYLN